MKRVVKKRGGRPKKDLKPVLVEIPKDVEWLEPPETFASKIDARAYRDTIENNIRLLRYQHMSGILISRDSVRRMAADVARRLGEALDAFAGRAAPELAALTDPRQVRAYLQTHLAQEFLSVRNEWDKTQNIVAVDLALREE